MSYPQNPQWQPHGPYPLYPAPPAYGPPPRKSRGWVWIAVVAVVVIAIVVGAIILVTSGGGGQATRGQSQKADITRLTADMVIPESDFPSLPDGVFRSYPVDEAPSSGSFKVSPPECGLIVNGPPSKQRARARVKANSKVPSWLNMLLFITRDRTDLKSLRANCAGQIHYGESDRDLNKNTIDVRMLDVAKVPSWAVLLERSGKGTDPTQQIMGYYRGVLVIASYATKQAQIESSNTDDLVEVFNAQIDRLEAQS